MDVVTVSVLMLSSLALSHGWTCTPAPQLRNAARVDAGQGQVVATDTANKAFFLSGDTWYPLTSANMKHVSVGHAGTWGVDPSDKIFKLVAGDWEQYPGGLKQLDAGGDAFVVGVNSGDGIYCLGTPHANGFVGGSTNSQWKQLPGKLKYISCGPNGCWGVNSGDGIYIMKTLNPGSCSHGDWENIPGGLSMIEVGDDGKVFGVSGVGEVFTRAGITSALAEGSEWVQIQMCAPVKHVTYDLDRLWALTTSGVLLTCRE